MCLVAESYPTLCDPMDCSLLGSSVQGDSPGKNTGVYCYALLQEIFPTQGSNPGLPHYRQILYCLSHQGSPNYNELSPYTSQNVALCLVTQLSPTVCNPVGCSPPGSSVHGDSPGKNTGVSCHPLF